MTRQPPKTGAGYYVVNYLVRPPLVVLGFILSPVWFLFGLSDKQLALRDQKKLEQEIRHSMPFLFDEHHGRIVPNQGVPFPPGFDYAFVTVAVDNLSIRFCRGRGELDIRIARTDAPNDLHDLALLVALMDRMGYPQSWRIGDLRQASRLLEPQMDRLKQAFGEGADRDLTQLLAEARESERTAIREAEWEINKRTKR